MLLAVLLVFAAAFACLLFDSLNTVKGIKAGVAVEGNPLITVLSRTNKPALWQLLLIDGTLRVALLSLAALGRYSPAFYGMSIGGLATIAVKNIIGGRAWIKLMQK